MEEAWRKTYASIKTALPIVAGVIMLLNLVNPLLSQYYGRIFTGNLLLDPLIGAVAGTVSFGIPVVSYVAGGEMLAAGVSLVAVTAFILSWSLVNFVMLPLEIANLGRGFALRRNVANFFISIIIAVLTVLTLGIFA